MRPRPLACPTLARLCPARPDLQYGGITSSSSGTVRTRCRPDPAPAESSFCGTALCRGRDRDCKVFNSPAMLRGVPPGSLGPLCPCVDCPCRVSSQAVEDKCNKSSVAGGGTGSQRVPLGVDYPFATLLPLLVSIRLLPGGRLDSKCFEFIWSARLQGPRVLVTCRA